MKTLKSNPKCIVCSKKIKPAGKGIDTWEAPASTVIFQDAGNYGSALYDTLMDHMGNRRGSDGGIERIEILVCDECLKTKRNYINIIRRSG
jgi:hypothetical protein